MAEKEIYEVIVTNPAIDRFQDEILGYIERNYSVLRAIEIEAELVKMVRSLSLDPQRGALERWIKGNNKRFRFLVYKETKFFEVKILYFIEEVNLKVIVTDFFPTRMNPSKMKIN